MKKAIKITLIAVICFTVLFCLTVVSNPDYAVRFGLASGPGKPVEITNTEPAEQEVAVGGDLVPMVFIDGQLYCDIGEESTITARCGMMDGEITSTVKQSEEPTQDNQSNFGTGYVYQYGPNGTIEILINDKWWVFAVMADAV